MAHYNFRNNFVSGGHSTQGRQAEGACACLQIRIGWGRRNTHESRRAAASIQGLRHPPRPLRLCNINKSWLNPPFGPYQRPFESYRAHRGNCRGQERALHGSGGRLSLNPPKKSRLDKPIAANPSGFRVHGAKSLKVRQQPPPDKAVYGGFCSQPMPGITPYPSLHTRSSHQP